MQLPEHGANPQIVYGEFGMEMPVNVLDFSENVNPAGPPKIIFEQWTELAAKLTAYPSPDAEPFLSAAARYHQIESACLFAGNGAAELLALIAERYRGGKAIVVHPTFSEYEATLKAKNVEVMRVLATEIDGFKLPIHDVMKAMESASVLYLCTPNNPTGVMLARSDLLELIERGRAVNCDVVLDEAFIDFVDESLSFIGELMNYPHVIVVRSMTKMYAIPGIRLGYVVANENVIRDIKVRAPHWNVNGIAAQIGALCLQEVDYREEAIAHSAREREEMRSFLQTHGCIVTDSVANFISFRPRIGRDARKLYRDMLEQGIVLRHSENFLGMDGQWLRIGMKNEVDMNRLKKELSQWFADN